MEKGYKKEYFDVIYTVHTIKKGMQIGTLYYAVINICNTTI